MLEAACLLANLTNAREPRAIVDGHFVVVPGVDLVCACVAADPGVYFSGSTGPAARHVEHHRWGRHTPAIVQKHPQACPDTVLAKHVAKSLPACNTDLARRSQL